MVEENGESKDKPLPPFSNPFVEVLKELLPAEATPGM